MEIVVLLIVLAVVLVGSTVAFVTTRRGRERGYLEAPPDRTVLRPTSGQPGAPAASSGVATAPPPGSAPPAEGDPDVLAPEPDAETVAEIEEALAEAEVVEVVVRPRFRDRLTKARGLFSGYFGSILSRSTIDAETWDDLEEALLRADVGIGLTTSVLDELRDQVRQRSITEPTELLDQLKADLKARLAVPDRSLVHKPGATNVWLFVGVNGVGKTTTIGKLGKQQAVEGRRVVMAAGDTFRAAAAEQLGTWAERTGADFVRGAEGGDPSSVIFDAVQRADARGADLVLADTAGRLHTKTNLMDELRKVRRVAEKPPGDVTEVLLVLDATTGQNGLTQAKQFLEAVDVTGVVLTKLDGSAKGGIVLAIQSDLGIPVKLVGLGETVDDLVPFDPDEFVEALFA
jgi:fused signal recognition particle receptor